MLYTKKVQILYSKILILSNFSNVVFAINASSYLTELASSMIELKLQSSIYSITYVYVRILFSSSYSTYIHN